MLETLRKLYGLLDARGRRNAAIILCMMLVLGLIEAAGVASIMPFIAVAVDPAIVERNPYLNAVYQWLGFKSTSDFLLLLAVVVFVLVIVRICFSIGTQYAMVRFANMRNHAISSLLLQRYLYRPYSWFLNRHGADLGKAVLSEVDEVTRGSLVPALQMISSALISAAVIAVLVAVSPAVALAVIAVLGGFYSLVYLFVRKFIARIGQERFVANRRRFLIAHEVLGGIKEVKVSGMEEAYLQRFGASSLVLARRKSVSRVLAQIPRYFFEIVALGGMLIVVMVLLVRSSGDLGRILPILALYTFSGLRLMPALQQIYSSLASIGFSRPAIETLYADLQEDPRPAPPRVHAGAEAPLHLNEGLELRGVFFSYPKADRSSIADISLTIAARTTVAFVGATGAGKTTIADIILGLLDPDRGEVRVDGTLLTPANMRSWQRSIGYVPQFIFLADDTVAANIAFGLPPGKIDMEAVRRAARFAELDAFVTGELPEGYQTLIGERGIRLSGGQRQRIGIARALYNDPDVLLLDEATSALDNLTERAVMDAVQNVARRKTVILIAHRLTTVRACDTLFLLERGRLKAFGSYDDLVLQEEEFRRMAAV